MPDDKRSMPRAMILLGFVWPFLVGIVGGFIAAFAEITDSLMWSLIMIALAGSVPGVFTGFYRQSPAHWNELARGLLTLGASAVILAIEFAIAGKIFAIVYISCGGYVPA